MGSNTSGLSSSSIDLLRDIRKEIIEGLVTLTIEEFNDCQKTHGKTTTLQVEKATSKFNFGKLENFVIQESQKFAQELKEEIRKQFLGGGDNKNAVPVTRGETLIGNSASWETNNIFGMNKTTPNPPVYAILRHSDSQDQPSTGGDLAKESNSDSVSEEAEQKPSDYETLHPSIKPDPPATGNLDTKSNEDSVPNETNSIFYGIVYNLENLQINTKVSKIDSIDAQTEQRVGGENNQTENPESVFSSEWCKSKFSKTSECDDVSTARKIHKKFNGSSENNRELEDEARSRKTVGDLPSNHDDVNITSLRKLLPAFLKEIFSPRIAYPEQNKFQRTSGIRTSDNVHFQKELRAEDCGRDDEKDGNAEEQGSSNSSEDFSNDTMSVKSATGDEGSSSTVSTQMQQKPFVFPPSGSGDGVQLNPIMYFGGIKTRSSFTAMPSTSGIEWRERGPIKPKQKLLVLRSDFLDSEIRRVKIFYLKVIDVQLENEEN